MAQPSNTFDTYDAKGIREDLSDIIYNITPDDTPFYSACKKVKATNTLHEWQTDTLRSSATNAHIEGDDTSADAAVATSRLGNYTQIFKNAVTIADTEESVDKAGRKNEIAYQTLKIAREQKLDIEKALFENNAREAGNSTTARELAGAGAWVKSNQSIGAGGAAPAGDGTDARTDGTQEAFTQAKFDSVMESIWTNGGTPDKVYLSPFQMNVALGFTGGGNSRRNIDAASETVYNSVDVYVTPWGSVEFTPSRENRSRDVYIMQSDMWCVGVLRPTKNVGLAKTGDSTKRQVLTELTLVAKNESANGIVADLSTS